MATPRRRLRIKNAVMLLSYPVYLILFGWYWWKREPEEFTEMFQ